MNDEILEANRQERIAPEFRTGDWACQSVAPPFERRYRISGPQFITATEQATSFPSRTLWTSFISGIR